MDILVFVYGTLRQGYNNHHLLSDARFFGRGQTIHAYAMYAADVPFVTAAQPVSRITGEVYAVNERQLQALDALEEHPHWYCREQVAVALETGEICHCWLYFNATPEGDLVASGDYADFRRTT